MKTLDPTYLGDGDALIAHWEIRRAPIKALVNETLPDLSVDLTGLGDELIIWPVDPPTPQASGFAKKQHALAEDLAGHSKLALLNALVIAHLRKRDYPQHAPALFRKIWAEHATALLVELPTRWLISSAITFADHGPTEPDRRVGQSLNILFSLMKIYEFERQFSGTASTDAYSIDQRRKEPMPMEMPDFSLASGGLDINLLAPIWQLAKQAPAIGPLACHLLETLNRDPRNVFRRINTMRQNKRKQLEVKSRKQ